MIRFFLENLERLFGWLVQASWQASVLVALVLLFQRIFRARLNSRWTHALWLLVIARLLLPALPESALSLFQFAPPPPPVLMHSVTEPIFAPAVSTVVADRPALPPAAAPRYPFSACTLLALVWLAGALGLLVLTWQVNRRFGRHVRHAPPIDDPVLIGIASAAQAELGLHRSLRLIESAHVQGPAIMGLINPTLILPQNARAKFTDSELRFIFLHEFAHLKRGDLILQWLVAILQILHWFNPVLWYAFRRMRADREPAADALVLSRTGDAEQYGHVLIKLLEHYHQRHALPTLVGILEDKDQFKRRFTLIGQFTRGAYGWSLLGLLLLGTLAAVGLTAAREKAGARDSGASVADAGLIPETKARQIIAAVKKDDAAALSQLVEGVDVDQIRDENEPLLFDVRSPAIAEILLRHGANANERNSSGDPALVHLVRNGGPNSAGTAQALINHGADVNARSTEGGTGETPLLDARDGATVDLLIAHGADIKAKWSFGGNVFAGAGIADVSMFEALLRHGIPFDPKNDGPTVLLNASWIGNTALMEDLLKRGVDPNAKGIFSYDHAGKPIFMLPLVATTTGAGKTRATQLLLAHGARGDDVMLNAIYNRLKDVVKLLWERGVRNISPLKYAISQGVPIDELRKLLDQGSPADPPQDKTLTPLATATLNGNFDAVVLLVSRGADVNRGESAPDPKYPFKFMTPLVAASGEGQDAIVAYLLAHGAQPDPGALWQAAENSTPYHTSYEQQLSHDHFEKTARILLDAGALKNTTAQQQGFIISAAIQTRQGPPNLAVLKMLLDAGADPNAPMPYIVDNGEKPNSVIGYFRDHYAKFASTPTPGQLAAELKPALDLMEAKVGNKPTNTTVNGPALDVPADAPPLQQKLPWPVPSTVNAIGFPLADSGEVSRPTDPTINDTIERLIIHQLDVTDMPLQYFMSTIARQLKKEHPEEPLWSTELMSADPPYRITFHLQHPASVREILQQLNLTVSYPIRFSFRGQPNDLIVWQVPWFERAFDQKAAGTTIQWNLGQTDVRTALQAVDDAAAAQGFAFNLRGVEKIGKNFGTTVNAPVALPQGPVTVDQALRRVLTAGNVRLVAEQGGIDTSPIQPDISMKDADFAAVPSNTPPAADPKLPAQITPAEMKAVEDSRTPLMKALQLRDYAKARALLTQGADVNATDKMGNTALGFLMEWSSGPFPLDILKVLLERGRDPNPLVHAEFSSPARSDPVLDIAVMDAEFSVEPDLADIRQAAQMLFQHGAAFATAKGDEQTLLQASVRGDLSTVRQLIAKGVSLNAADANGWTPLMLSIAFDRTEITSWLLAHGADVNVPSARGAEDPLTWAAERGNDDLVEKLIARGAKAGLAWRGLQRSVERNDPRLFDDLIKAGADPKQFARAWAGDSNGKPQWRQIVSEPLYTTIEKGQTSMALTILDKGVDPEPVDVQNGRNYAYWAVYYDRSEVLQSLLDHGANPLTKDSWGETPLSLAQKSHPDLVPMLQAAIAKAHGTTSTVQPPAQLGSPASSTPPESPKPGADAQLRQDSLKGLSDDPQKSITSATSLNGMYVADIEADATAPGRPERWVVRSTKTNEVLASGPTPRNPQRKVEPIGSDQVRIEWNYTPFPECFFVLTVKRPDRVDGLLVGLFPTDNKGHFSSHVTDLDWGPATKMTSCAFIGDAELKIMREVGGKSAPFYLTVDLSGVVQGSPVPPDMARIKLRHMLKVIEVGDAPQLQQMIDQGVDCKKLEASFKARPRLLLETVNPKVAEILIRNGIDPNARDSSGVTTLGMVVQAQTSSRDMTDVARVILDHGADPNFRMGKSGVTAVMLAYAGKLVDLLVARGADPKLTTSNGQNAFHFSEGHDVSALEALTRHGTPFDPKRDGPDLLATAYVLDNKPVVQWLLNHGVDAHAPGSLPSAANSPPSL